MFFLYWVVVLNIFWKLAPDVFSHSVAYCIILLIASFAVSNLLVWCDTTYLFLVLWPVLLMSYHEITANIIVMKLFSCFLPVILQFQVLHLNLQSIWNLFLYMLKDMGPDFFFFFLMWLSVFSTLIFWRDYLFPIVHSWHHYWRWIDSIWMDLFLGSTVFPFVHLESFYSSFKTLLKRNLFNETFPNPPKSLHRSAQSLFDLSIHSGCLWVCMCSMWGVIIIWSVP